MRCKIGGGCLDAEGTDEFMAGREGLTQMDHEQPPEQLSNFDAASRYPSQYHPGVGSRSQGGRSRRRGWPWPG